MAQARRATAQSSFHFGTPGFLRTWAISKSLVFFAVDLWRQGMVIAIRPRTELEKEAASSVESAKPSSQPHGDAG